MTPRSSSNNTTNRLPRDTEEVAECCCTVRGAEYTNCARLVRGQPSEVVAFPPVATPFLNHICAIHGGCPEKQMRGVYACSVVTTVTDLQSLWNRPECALPRHAVRAPYRHLFVDVVPNKAIAFGAACSHPHVTRFGVPNPGIKGFTPFTHQQGVTR
jgi:hypothetical protein